MDIKKRESRWPEVFVTTKVDCGQFRDSFSSPFIPSFSILFVLAGSEKESLPANNKKKKKKKQLLGQTTGSQFFSFSLPVVC